MGIAIPLLEMCIGLAELIGIPDLAKPAHGDSVALRSDELPMFWACGVTPQAVIVTAKPFAITHAPGRMLVTDLQNAQLAVHEEGKRIGHEG